MLFIATRMRASMTARVATKRLSKWKTVPRPERITQTVMAATRLAA